MYALRNVSRWGLKAKPERQISMKKRKKNIVHVDFSFVFVLCNNRRTRFARRSPVGLNRYHWFYYIFSRFEGIAMVGSIFAEHM